MLKKILIKIKTVFFYYYCVKIKKVKMRGIPIVISSLDCFDIDNESFITIGRKFAARKNSLFESKNGGKMSIGDNVFFNRECIVTCFEKITIGDRCIFGPNVKIYDHDHDIKNHKVDLNSFSTGSIFIGEDCWIGTGCIILKRTKIGNGCIIGAGCIVKGDIPDNSVVKSDRKLKIELNYAE